MQPMLRSSLGSRCFALAGMRQSEGSAGARNTGEAPLMATAKAAQPTGRIGLLPLSLGRTPQPALRRCDTPATDAHAFRLPHGRPARAHLQGLTPLC